MTPSRAQRRPAAASRRRIAGSARSGRARRCRERWRPRRSPRPRTRSVSPGAATTSTVWLTEYSLPPSTRSPPLLQRDRWRPRTAADAAGRLEGPRRRAPAPVLDHADALKEDDHAERDVDWDCSVRGDGWIRHRAVLDEDRGGRAQRVVGVEDVALRPREQCVAPFRPKPEARETRSQVAARGNAPTLTPTGGKLAATAAFSDRRAPSNTASYAWPQWILEM